MTNNRIVLDLNKVQFGVFYYTNQEGLVVHTKPRSPSVRGMELNTTEMAHWHESYPCETLLERARRLGILDVWTPWVRFDLSANRTVRYTGKKAIEMWKVWRAKIYGKTTTNAK